MQNAIINEHHLISEIDKLREQFTQTQDLYREVCALLFFRYGTAPTANKLYQLVRKGSMSAPAEALNKFWSDLREKSRVRIEHPDLPDSLRTAAGELTATLWSAAQAAAAESLAALRSEAQAIMTEAKADVDAAKAQLATAQAELERSQTQTEAVKQENLQLQQMLAAERARREAIESQLDKAQADIASHQEAQESARRYFAEEMEKLRTAAQVDKERFGASERRFLQEIDRERRTAAKAQKEVEQVRQEAVRMQEQLRAELAGLQTQTGDLRQQLGILEGKLHGAQQERDQLGAELRASQMLNTDHTGRLGQLSSEVEMWRQRCERAEAMAEEWKVKAQSKPVGRRPKAD